MAKLFGTFSQLQEQIKKARKGAHNEARETCGPTGFYRSRGVWMVTCSSKDGLVAPLSENFFTGKAPTGSQFDDLIAKVLAHFPRVDSISFEGGWDFAQQMADFEDGGYDAWVSSWTVEAWCRDTTRTLDEMVRMHSCFESLDEMVLNTHSSYRPSLATKRGADESECAELTLIADAYDAAQQLRGDERRAYRY